MNNIHTDGLTLAYNGRSIIHNLNISVHPGEIVGLIGPNGAGKTTLIRALAGLMAPQSGQALLNGQNICNLSPAIRAQMLGLVPQGETHAWPLSVAEVVALGRAPHRGWYLPMLPQDRAMIEQALDLTELQQLRDRPVDKLSGGERQRLLIARALAQEPQVLLLDEPTANLDIHHQIQILNLVRELVDGRSLTAIIAIHDLTMAARTCDRLILLHQGACFADGAPESVLTRENLRAVFDVDAALYRDPHGQWALSVRAATANGTPENLQANNKQKMDVNDE